MTYDFHVLFTRLSVYNEYHSSFIIETIIETLLSFIILYPK
jgi:hypothetical protein